MTRETELAKIGRDLELCDLGMLITTGQARRRLAQHRAACMARIAEMNREDGLDDMTLEELLAALQEGV